MTAREKVRAALLRGKTVSWSNDFETQDLIPEDGGRVTLFYTSYHPDEGGGFSGTKEYDTIDAALDDNNFYIDEFAEDISDDGDDTEAAE